MDATTPTRPTSADASASPHRRITVLLTIALVLYWLVAFLGTHVPFAPGVIPWGDGDGGGDKVLHFVGYGILASLLMGLRASRGPFGWYSVLMRWLVLALYGAFDEVTQSLVGRHADVTDWYADLLGSLGGLGLVVLLVRTGSRRRAKHEAIRSADKVA